MKNLNHFEKQFVDLHLHTTNSDGTASAAQVVKDCALLGLETIAITDHDNYKGYFEAKEEAKKWRLNVITGVEISTDKYHILGYDFDINNQKIINLIDKNRLLVNEMAYRRVEILQKQGIPLTKEKVNKYFPNGMINKVHILMSMFLDPECEQYIKGKTTGEIYHKYLGKNTAVSNIERFPLVEPKEYIKTIKEAGGISVLAHPFSDVNDMKEIDILRKYGLDGIEIQPHFKERNEPFIKYAKEHNMITTYGSDYHGARYLKRPLLGREHNNKIIPFWKNELTGLTNQEMNLAMRVFYH